MRFLLTLALITLIVGMGKAEAYSLDVKPDESQALRFVQVSKTDYAVTFFGQSVILLKRRGDELFNPAVRGVTGLLKGTSATVKCRKFIRRPAELVFEKGVLKTFSRRRATLAQKIADERMIRAKVPMGLNIGCLWPTEKAKAVQTRDWWNVQGGKKRLRLWYFNPNAAGTLFAELALLGLGLVVLVRQRPVKGAGALMFGVFLVLLFLTGSRGSFLALGAGALALLLFSAKEPANRRICGIVALVLLVGAVLLAGGLFGTRFGSNLLALDWSNQERLRIWREVPRMLAAAAPGGWGLDRSGLAYCDWFQPMGAFHPVKWLVSSHLTWIVEFGRWFFAGYAFAWMSLLSVSAWLAVRGNRWAAGALGLLALWFVAIWFSTVGVFVSLWILPAVAAGAVLVCALRFGQKAIVPLLVSCATAALALPFAVEAAGRRMPPLRGCELTVSRQGKVTVVGRGKPSVYVVSDVDVLTGDNIGAFGRDVRGYARRHGDLPTFAVVDSIDDLPREAEHLVLCGRACRAYLQRREAGRTTGDCPKARTMVFLSPPFCPAAIPQEMTRDRSLCVVYGEFARRLDAGLRELPPWCQTVPGAELYIPNWLKWVRGGKKGKKK